MPMAGLSIPSPRITVFSLLWLTALAVGVLVFTLWFGVNTDRQYVHPLLSQLIPAGHCTCASSTTFECASCLSCASNSKVEASPSSSSSSSPPWSFQYGRDDRNEALDKGQCLAAFPGLFEDVSRAAAFWEPRGGITAEDLDAIELKNAMARAFIYKGELYVVAARAKGEDHRRKILAILSAIHRALVAAPDRAQRPDVEFVFSIEDRVDDVMGLGHPAWVLARRPTEEAVWLMPDFGFWAWDNLFNSIGPYSQVVGRIERSELPWPEKKRKLVWRGKPSFAPKLRRALMDAARGKPWDDVKQVDWVRKTNLMGMEDHCDYMFIAHVEGRHICLLLYHLCFRNC